MLRITLFGAPTVSWHDQALDIPRRTVRALLFVLAAQPQPMAREFERAAGEQAAS
jgi:DNA-binding SARP family transcriptional activator